MRTTAKNFGNNYRNGEVENEHREKRDSSKSSLQVLYQIHHTIHYPCYHMPPTFAFSRGDPIAGAVLYAVFSKCRGRFGLCIFEMVKTKQRQNITLSHLSGSSNSIVGLDMHGDDSWVVVKKQIVAILVPSMAIAQKSSTSIAGQSQLQPIAKEVTKCQSGALEKTCLEVSAAVLPSASKNVKLLNLPLFIVI
ncbi:hypothetical protein SDJN03_11703, partial [Cucurbita argyrosperma subsp. sororia]